MNHAENEPQASGFSWVFNYFLKCGIFLKKSKFPIHSRHWSSIITFLLLLIFHIAHFACSPKVEWNFLSLLKLHWAVYLPFVYHEIIRTDNSCNAINNLILLGYNLQGKIFRGCTFNQQCSVAIYIYKAQNLRRNISTSRLKIVQTISKFSSQTHDCSHLLNKELKV